MTRFAPLRWLAFALLLFFYGFSVFALTRDYYLRHPARPPATANSPGADAPSPFSANGAIPEALAETNPQLLRQRADRLFVEQRYAEALPVYRRLLVLRPGDAEAHNDLGLALFYTGDSAGAIASLETAIAKDPTLQRAWLTFGFINLQTGRPDAATTALGRARDLDPASEIGKEAVRLLEILASPAP